MKFALQIARASVVPLIVAILWHLSVSLKWLPPSLSALPADVFATLAKLIYSGQLISDAFASMLRLLLGLFVGAGTGISVGLLLSQVNRINSFFGPSLRFLAPVPVIAWMPFAIAVLGTGEFYKIAMVGLSTFFVCTTHTFAGAVAVPRRYMELSAMYGKTLWERISLVTLPHALPSILTGVRLSLSLGWVVLLFVEFASSSAGSEGLGWLMSDARALGKTEIEYAVIFAIAALGFISDIAAQRTSRLFCPWLESQAQPHSILA